MCMRNCEIRESGTNNSSYVVYECNWAQAFAECPARAWTEPTNNFINFQLVWAMGTRPSEDLPKVQLVLFTQIGLLKRLGFKMDSTGNWCSRNCQSITRVFVEIKCTKTWDMPVIWVTRKGVASVLGIRNSVTQPTRTHQSGSTWINNLTERMAKLLSNVWGK